MTLVRELLDNAGDARAMGVRFLAHHLKRRSAFIRVPVKGVGTVMMRGGSSDPRVFRQVFSKGQYELRWYGQWPGIDARYRGILDGGQQPLIIDAGANNGASALWFAREFPQAKVVAVEPEPVSVSLCRENTKGFGVEVVAKAIGSESGSVDLLTDDRESWAVATTRAPEGEVEVCTVNEIVKRHGDGAALFLVKIDIEGFESDLFASQTEWVDNAHVIMLEPHDWMLPGQATSRNFQTVLARHDFDLLISGENLIYVRRDSAEIEPSSSTQVLAEHR